ncbi:MAG: 3-oxoacyl-ACP synthase [Armatimonadota bacterium]|nr:3-oxoacyl-ACP synthase [Armatimonadota bacterium]MDR7447757.1 3-oxoacyl-ACP synthase [Armatimonadota bacterium]MDR7458534.1 3-oxoacyl-ACP synthase [Armatimonadota bacterium]MDR7479909.1 3-oxoacyl-ACP synthase [Armatimonadota bacterium]MDR7487743.1 3-oxoacyl-ACP synthase [Armatimonadota bacterium]
MSEVRLTAINTYFPAGYQPAAAIAAASGIPEAVITAKFGLTGKHVAGTDEHVSDLAIRAARPLVDGRGEVDAVIYFGSAHKDYYLWAVAPKIQHALGLHRAFALELMATSACGPIALKVARDMLLADRRLRGILLVGASRESSIIDYRNGRSRFAFTFADGAAAALLRRGPGAGHRVLASAILTDGAFADDVMVPAGGSVLPPSHETVERGLHHLDVPDPQGMKARLDPVSLGRFVEVVRRALEGSGAALADLDFLAVLHLKRSMHRALLQALGLEPHQSVYLERFGHMSAIDPLVALAEGERLGRLRPGHLAVALSAGTGYTWAATAIRW